MTYPNSVLMALLFSFFLGCPPSNGVEPRGELDSKPEKPLLFKWLAGAMVESEKGRVFHPLKTGTTLSSGAEMNIVADFPEKAFVYVFWEDTNRSVSVLFPRNPKELSGNQTYPRVVSILSNVPLDENVGKERVHLIVSRNRLVKLDELIRQSTESWKENPLEDIKERNKEVLSQIQILKRDHAGLQIARSRPVSIGGVLRSGDDELSNQKGTEFTVNGFLYKRFTIDHR